MAVTRIVKGLTPCPFCGCTRLRVWVMSDSTHVTCRKCAAEGPPVSIDPRADPDGEKASGAAIVKWNKRARS